MNKILRFYKGRITRKTFLIGWGIFITLAMVIAFLALSITDGFSHATSGAMLLLIVSLLALYGYLFSLVIRRLHDLGASGWWSLLLFLSPLSFFLQVFLACKSGEKKENSYGPQP